MANILHSWLGCSVNGVANKIDVHNEDANAHLSLQKNINDLQKDFLQFKLTFGQVTENAFSITFENLDAIDSSQIGVWNEEAERIEF